MMIVLMIKIVLMRVRRKCGGEVEVYGRIWCEGERNTDYGGMVKRGFGKNRLENRGSIFALDCFLHP